MTAKTIFFDKTGHIIDTVIGVISVKAGDTFHAGRMTRKVIDVLNAFDKDIGVAGLYIILDDPQPIEHTAKPEQYLSWSQIMDAIYAVERETINDKNYTTNQQAAILTTLQNLRIELKKTM